MGSKIAVCVLIGVFFSLAGCDKINTAAGKPAKDKSSTEAAKGPIVAKVNNYPITLEDISQEIEAYNSIVSAEKPELKISTRDQKISYLKNEIIRRILLYQEALNRGLDRNKEVVKALEKTKIELLWVKLLRDETEKIDVSAKEIEEYYNIYKDQLREPEERQIREIAVPGEQEAKDILIQLLQGQDFATIAREKSRVGSAGQGGDLGFISRGKKFAQFDDAAFSDTLEAGKVSNIFKGSDGQYYIVKLEAKRGGKQKSLNEMWEDIKRALTIIKQQQKIEEIIAKLSREAKLEIYEGEIK